MYRVALKNEDDFAGWRKAARALALADIPPEQVEWQVGEGGDLFAGEGAGAAPPDPPEGAEFSVPRQFMTLAEDAFAHPDKHRFEMLYELLLKVRATPRAIMDVGDPLVSRLSAMALEPRLEALEKRNDKDAALAELIVEAKDCKRCPLYKDATQTVFGEGAASARLMLMGEQPGDQEDLAGRPFVGPAGQMLDRGLREAGIDRAETYVTNAVKHFRFEQRGPRRIHQKPDTSHIEACRWWFAQERVLVRPPVTVALGGSAAHALLGRKVTIGRTRGEPIPLKDGLEGWVTVHPSYLLRIPDKTKAEEEYGRFVEDLKGARKRAKELA
ncbi:MAG: UdgX family uracil-DNA binding protein [Parasphingopyxis sp.]|nr:UdgX family uracil-DNA binding protein [Sphingomonadales bacterium]